MSLDFLTSSIFIVFIASIITNLISSFFYKTMIDKEKVKEIKRKIKEIQEEANKKKKEGDMQSYYKLLSEANTYVAENFRMMIKPLSFSIIPNLILFFFLSYNYKNTVFKSPIPLPFVGENIHWILFFVISSLSLNMLFKKIFDLDF
jgi:uncharacterized membrane protein (DUF106 family)